MVTRVTIIIHHSVVTRHEVSRRRRRRRRIMLLLDALFRNVGLRIITIRARLTTNLPRFRSPGRRRCEQQHQGLNSHRPRPVSFHFADASNNTRKYRKTRQGNRRYQTSPALCNPTAPFAANRPHRLRPEIFRILVITRHTRDSFHFLKYLFNKLTPSALAN